MAEKKKKQPLDLVHQNEIHVETVKKEQRLQKLHTEFSMNPYRKCKSAAPPVLLSVVCP